MLDCVKYLILIVPVLGCDSGEEQDASTSADHRRTAAERGQGERAGTGATCKCLPAASVVLIIFIVPVQVYREILQCKIIKM